MESNILNLIGVYLSILLCLKVEDKYYRLSLFVFLTIKSREAI